MATPEFDFLARWITRNEEYLGEVWYFIIATIVFTFIGIISVLTYLGV